MEEDNISEKIGKLRRDMEGYELKVKPMVEVLSAFNFCISPNLCRYTQ